MGDPNASDWLKSQQKASRKARWLVGILGLVVLLALHKSLYGINYGPVNATYPWCTNTLGDVIEDIKLLSQLTNRIRLYGMDCQMANMTLWAIKLLNVNMTVIPTIWVDNNATTYQRQYNSLFTLINDHGVDKIDGISVGNEVLFRKEITPQDLFNRIADVRQKVNALPNVKKKVPVFTSDLGSNVNDALVAAVDIALANVHPYFGGVPAQQGANWTFEFFQQNDVVVAAKAGKEAIISEIGWPTAGNSQQAAVASVPNLNDFIQSFICAANTKQVKYYYFESFDTPWKTAMFTLLEGSWGLFTPDRKLKDVTIPDCPPTAPGFNGFS
ncbi:6572_t:CDS:2 [Paraglomus occultum]|uniref:glucan endo-1,3-beta-D-glucosidase n=1 Tax=Paraglomus occultum TaxID=144539 RepID=A0A9N8ZIK6_9GLOM|nr:6572_t:CDS:2 [Paraglomus occultum]